MERVRLHLVSVDQVQGAYVGDGYAAIVPTAALDQHGRPATVVLEIGSPPDAPHQPGARQALVHLDRG